MKGTWQTDDHAARSGGLVLVLIGAAIVAGSGAAAAIATAVIIALIAVAAVIVLAVAGLGAWLVYRARHGHAIIRPPVTITSPGRAPLPPATTAPGSPRAALQPPAARELHLHFHGTNPAEVAEILRHGQPECNPGNAHWLTPAQRRADGATGGH